MSPVYGVVPAFVCSWMNCDWSLVLTTCSQEFDYETYANRAYPKRVSHEVTAQSGGNRRKKIDVLIVRKKLCAFERPFGLVVD